MERTFIAITIARDHLLEIFNHTHYLSRFVSAGFTTDNDLIGH